MHPSKQIEALAAVLDIIVETVRDSGKLGAPAGHMFAALQAKLGWDLEKFERIMGALVQAKRLEKRGHCYFIGRKA